MTDEATAIIADAIAALKAEAADIQGKIVALEGALGGDAVEGSVLAVGPSRRSIPTDGRRRRKSLAPPSVVKRAQVSLPRDERVNESKKLDEGTNKRSTSWTPEKKQAAAERMRKYWADRKK
ncbi:MAG: hypothetical protein KTR25_10790 [Myxococcales bacterium]|nr:hypothetical protein [Myxococcales bacterium]